VARATERSGGGDLAPPGKGFGPEGSERAVGDQVALDVEVVVDGGVGGEEALRRTRGSEAEVLAFSAAGRLMRLSIGMETGL
jgi:hypothetical protein